MGQFINQTKLIERKGEESSSIVVEFKSHPIRKIKKREESKVVSKANYDNAGKIPFVELAMSDRLAMTRYAHRC
jgi:hypothetical protein